MKSKNKLRFPYIGTCFYYFFDEANLTLINRKEQLKESSLEETDLFNDIIIPNVEVTCLGTITEVFFLEEKPVLFIGVNDTGKNSIVKYFMKKYIEELVIIVKKYYILKNYLLYLLDLIIIYFIREFFIYKSLKMF